MAVILSTLAAQTTARLVHEYELAERRPVHQEKAKRRWAMDDSLAGQSIARGGY
jgi:hypothetical protein